MRTFFNSIILLYLMTMFSSLSYASNKNHSVLALHSYHEDHIWTGFVKSGLNNVLDKVEGVSVFHEHLDTKRYPNFAHGTEFISYLNGKYANTDLDVIVVVDDAALMFMQQMHHRLFDGTPVVFVGINKIDDNLISDPNYTGVFENRDIASAIFDIKKLTSIDELIVITDQTKSGQDNLSKLVIAKGNVHSPKKIHVIVGLKESEIELKLSVFSENIPVFKIGQVINSVKNGALLSWNDGTLALTSAVKNPVFTLSSTSIGYGAVGVSELNGEKHGEEGAWYVSQILAGKKIDELPSKTNAKSTWTFNWELMQLYHYLQVRTPAGSIIINQVETFYKKYKVLVLGVIAFFIVALIVIGLLIALIRRSNQTRIILAENETRYKQLAQAGANIFWEVDIDYEITYVSGNTVDLLGETIEDLNGSNFWKVFSAENISEFPLEKARRLLSHKLPIEHLIFKRKTSRDRVKVLVINGSPMFNKNDQYCGYRGICNDVTVEHNLSEKLAYQAEYDSLTGLINRESFLVQLKYQKDKADKTSSFICFLDVDRFKVINDTAGHLVGDAMLTKIATEINQCIKEPDVLGRFGGDEFGLILVNKSQLEALALCEKILKNVNKFNFPWNDKNFTVGLSIGMVPIDIELSEVELLSKADMSCYKAKEQGRNRVYFADPNSSELEIEALQMGYIANISKALKDNQFYLVKQPIVASKSSEYHLHYEILLRFKDENGEMVPPDLFIPAAEKYGVITLIDYWVVRNVFESYNLFFTQGTLVSINLSGISLSNEGFIDKLTALVIDSPIDCCNICFEITETAIISNVSKALEFIDKMKVLGIQFALDDFGSGASSFGYLKQLPVDYLKIDGSLIKNMISEPIDKAIVQSIHEVAQMMGMKTIAEFVENDELRQALVEIGVDFVQGYGIGKPEKCKAII